MKTKETNCSYTGNQPLPEVAKYPSSIGRSWTRRKTAMLILAMVLGITGLVYAAAEKLLIETHDKLGINTASPKSLLSVAGAAAIGANYAIDCEAPVNGLLVEGNVGIGTNEPKAKLDVDGTVKATKFKGDGSDITLEKNESLKKALSKTVECEEHLCVIGGVVNKNGKKEAGQGFEVKKENNGLYLITFNKAFSKMPAASVTQIYPDPSEFGPGGDTRDNAVICGLDTQKVKVKTGGAGGDKCDRWFTFIIMGPRNDKK